MHVILNKFNWIWRFDRNGLIKHEARRAQNVMKWLRSQQNICGIMHNALMRRQSTQGIRWCLTCKIGFHRCGFIHILFHNNPHRHYTPWKENWAWITVKQVNEQNSAANNNKRFVCRINDYRYTFINSIHMLHAKKHHFSVKLLPINCSLVKRCFRCTKIHVCLRLRIKIVSRTISSRTFWASLFLPLLNISKQTNLARENCKAVKSNQHKINCFKWKFYR